jgi:hypothetical protein
MLRGYCLSPPFPKLETQCQNVLPTSFQREMHAFQTNVDSERNHPLAALKNEDKKRFERIQSCSHDWNKDELSKILKEKI